MSRVKIVLNRWLPLALLITAFCGLVYVSVQQSLRQNANDPQIQLAEDGGVALARGESVESVVPSATIDIARSSVPFVMVFDDNGVVLASSGQIHGQAPALPAGVLDYVQQHGEDRVTWQPEPGVRIAAVVMRYNETNSGYILAGRSLREVEKRESQVSFFAGATWLGTLITSLILVILGELTLTR